MAQSLAHPVALPFGAPAPRPGLAVRLLRAVAMRQSRMRLADLDDHLLRDIGLTRGQAAAESDQACWDAPPHWLR